MAKDIDLLSYWMPILRQLREFREIAKAEEPELRYLLEAIDRTLANMFIETADEYGIKRFEDMMGIFPEAGDSLETRRFNVLIKWNDKVPYTDKELYNRLLSLCGSVDKFQIDPNYPEFEISITTKLGIKGAFDSITNLLTEMLPCNLVLYLQNFMEASKSTPLSVGVVANTAFNYVITNDINAEYQADGFMYYGTGISKADTHIITHDIESNVVTVSPLNEAVVSSMGFTNVITNDVKLEDSIEGNLNNAIGASVAHTSIITHDIEVEATVNGNNAVASPVSTATVITIN